MFSKSLTSKKHCSLSLFSIFGALLKAEGNVADEKDANKMETMYLDSMRSSFPSRWWLIFQNARACQAVGLCADVRLAMCERECERMTANAGVMDG